jgi:hypothetical protein
MTLRGAGNSERPKGRGAGNKSARLSNIMYKPDERWAGMVSRTGAIMVIWGKLIPPGAFLGTGPAHITDGSDYRYGAQRHH